MSEVLGWIECDGITKKSTPCKNWGNELGQGEPLWRIDGKDYCLFHIPDDKDPTDPPTFGRGAAMSEVPA